MRRLIAVAVTLFALVAEPSAIATGLSRTASAPSFTPLTMPLEATPPEATRLPTTVETTAVLAVIRDAGVVPVPSAQRRRQPDVRPVVVVKQQVPRRFTGATGNVLRGSASWYCNADASRGPISVCHQGDPDTGGFDAYAAAGPRLRAAIGGSWRGRVVSVDGIRVKLVDWCQCHQGESNEKLIDVYRDVYGVVGGSVTIRW